MINICDLEKPESFDTELLESLPTAIIKHSEMLPVERQFLNGLVRLAKPKKVLEIGLSAGASSYVILNAIKDIDGCKLTSVDINENWYREPNKATGWVVKEYWRGQMPDWTLLTGKDPVEVMEKIGTDIDFCFIDTAHIHPIEMLNFLSVLPFLSEDAIVVVHDIALFANELLMHPMDTSYLSNAYGAKYLFDIVAANKICPDMENGEIANIGAFQINKNTKVYAENLFRSLQMRWIIPLHKDDKLMNQFQVFFEKYYSLRCAQLFSEAIHAQAKAEKAFEKNEDNKKINRILKRIQDKQINQVVIYGAGAAGDKIANALTQQDIGIKYLIDANTELQGKKKNGLDVMTMTQHLALENDFPIIIGSFRDEIIDEIKCLLEKAYENENISLMKMIYHV